MAKTEGYPLDCIVCGEKNDAFVILCWKDDHGYILRRRYCASWVSPTCWAAYERACTTLGW